MRRSQAQFAGKPVVGFQSDAVVGQVEPSVRGHHEIARVDEMGCVPQQDTSLMQSFADQGDVPLGEVAHSAVDQLGASAGSPVREVTCFDQERSITARCRVDGRAQPGGAAADDHDVPSRSVTETLEVFVASE